MDSSKFITCRTFLHFLFADLFHFGPSDIFLAHSFNVSVEIFFNCFMLRYESNIEVFNKKKLGLRI